ncbi:MAG: hypothetical protein VW079_00170 [Candidatus Woesearchaeota archaeon]|jgi:hypothetical protein
MSLIEAKRKLVFADYLLSRESSENFVTGATNHIISASKLAIKSYLQISDEELKDKDLVIKTFNKLNSEHSNFYNFYYKLINSEYSSYGSATNALNIVKDFVNWVENNRKKI